MQLPQAPAGMTVSPRVNQLGFSADNAGIYDIVYSTEDASEPYSDFALKSHRLALQPGLKNQADEFGRTAIWWAAALGRNNTYDALVKLGENPDVKPSQGPLAEYSARQLHDMSPEEIEGLL